MGIFREWLAPGLFRAKFPFGPYGPVPLLAASCSNALTGLLIIFCLMFMFSQHAISEICFLKTGVFFM